MTEIQTTDIQTKVFGDSASGLFQVLGRGELPLPGQCLACGNGTREEPFVFLGIHIDFHGALILCNLCLIQAAELVGCMAPSIADRNIKLATMAVDENVTLKLENEALRERLAVFDSALSAILSGTTSDRISISGDDSEAEPQESVSTEPVQPESTDAEPEPAEPVKDDGDSDSSRTNDGDITASVRPKAVRRKAPSV